MQNLIEIMSKSITCLALELPEAVHDDVAAKWRALKNDLLKPAFKINRHNNFIRVFRIPTLYPAGFCFGGGKDINFVMVDWFEPYPSFSVLDEDLGGLKPLADCPNQEVEINMLQRSTLNTLVSNFIRKKNYNNGSDLLALTDYGDTFIIKHKDDPQ